MKKYIFALSLLMIGLSTVCTASPSDTIKRQALQWFYERNEAREVNIVLVQENKALRGADSLCRLENESCRSAVTGLTTVVNDQAATIISQSEKITRLRKQRRWLIILTAIEAAVIVVLVR